MGTRRNKYHSLQPPAGAGSFVRRPASLMFAGRIATTGDRARPFANGLLGATCAAERPLFPINRLTGLSAFVLAKKP